MDSTRVEVTVCVPKPGVVRLGENPWMYRRRKDYDFEVSGDCLSALLTASKQLGAVVDGGQYVVRMASLAGKQTKPHVILYLVHKTHAPPAFKENPGWLHKTPPESGAE